MSKLRLISFLAVFGYIQLLRYLGVKETKDLIIAGLAIIILMSIAFVEGLTENSK